MAKLLRESCILLILLSSLIALTKVHFSHLNIDIPTIQTTFTQANFEDTRCRCTCPSTEYFSSKNITTSEHYRRYYTKANLDSANWFALLEHKHGFEQLPFSMTAMHSRWSNEMFWRWLTTQSWMLFSQIATADSSPGIPFC
jgi:hypothetical protein